MKQILATFLVLGLCMVQPALGAPVDDQDWISLVAAAAPMLSQDLGDVSAAARSQDLDAFAIACSNLFIHATTTKTLSEKCTVSSKYRISKLELELALDDLANSGFYGYQGATEGNATALSMSVTYMNSGSAHLDASLAALPNT